MEKKKTRKHALLSIPLVAVVLLNLYSTMLLSVVNAIAEACLGENGSYIAMIVFALIMLLIHKRWFSPEYKGSFRSPRYLDKRVLLPIFVFFVFDSVVGLSDGFTQGFNGLNISTFIIALYAGIVEEVIDRVLIMTTLVRTYIRKSSYLPALMISSFIFGFIHLSNLLAGANFESTIAQVATSLCGGLLLGAIFLRTGNILFSVFIHMMHDVACIAVTGSEVMTAGMTVKDWIVDILFMLVQILITVWLLKGHKEEIVAIWKERWSVTEEEEVQ